MAEDEKTQALVREALDAVEAARSALLHLAERSSSGGLADRGETAAGTGRPAMPPSGIDSTDTAVHPEPRESRQAQPKGS